MGKGTAVRTAGGLSQRLKIVSGSEACRFLGLWVVQEEQAATKSAKAGDPSHSLLWAIQNVSYLTKSHL